MTNLSSSSSRSDEQGRRRRGGGLGLAALGALGRPGRREKGRGEQGGSIPHLGSGWGGARRAVHGGGRRAATMAVAAALQAWE